MIEARRPAGRGAGAVALCLLIAAATVHAKDIEDFLGKPVASLRIQVEGRQVEDPALVALVDTRVGQPLRMIDVRETIAHLHGLGRFQDVQVRAAASAAGGVDLILDLVPIHAVRAVEFRGQLGVPEGTLRGYVRERFGATPTAGRAAEVARALTALLNDRGFLQARVTPEAVVEHAPDRTTLVFTVAAGPAAHVRRVSITSNESSGRPSIAARPRLQQGQVLDRIAIRDELDRYRAELKSRGFYQARADFVVRPGEDPGVADVQVAIDTGPLVQVVFRGDPMPVKERTESVPIAKEGSVDEDLLEDSRARIENYFRLQGYKDASAPYTWVGDEQAPQRQLVFTIARGRLYRVAGVEMAGNATVTSRELAPFIRTAAGQPFVDAVVTGDKSRIVEEYKRRGYASVKVDSVMAAGAAGNATQPPDAQAIPLTVAYQIVEGPRTIIHSVTFTGNTAFNEADLLASVTAQPGRPYYEPQIADDADAITLRYLNAGYATAVVEATPTPNADRTQMDVRYTIHEGVRVLVDHILVVGNNRTTPDMIARELTLKPGDPLGYSALVESQNKVSALGLFRRVRVTDVSHTGDEAHRDILVTVEEAPLTTYGFGGGVEGGPQLRRATEGGQAETVWQFAPRGFFEIGRRNLWGRNRTASLFTRVTLRPANQTTSLDPTASQGGYGFNEYRVLGTLREPRVLNTSADGLLTAFSEQAVRSSFNFARRAVQGEVARRLRSDVSVLGRYSFERARIFDARYAESEKPQIDRFFPQVRLSSFSTAVVRDTRDDPLDASRGVFASFDGSLAARVIGSEVGFARTFLQTFVYHALPSKRRLILAGGARLGVARGFPREAVDANGVVTTVRDIPASERFFAGGQTTVRGFGLDQLGAPGIVDSLGFSKGGDALVIMNLELRADIGKGLSAAGFLDAGNVWARVADVEFGQIRPSAGFGLRYKSPIGPLRFDIGFNLDRRIAGGRLEDARQYFITLGQAF